jgi:hypothetical protein
VEGYLKEKIGEINYLEDEELKNAESPLIKGKAKENGKSSKKIDVDINDIPM